MLHTHRSQSPGSSSDQNIHVLPPDAPLESILLAHSFKVIDHDTQLHITVDKENLWSASVSFYKAMNHNSKRFKWQLVVEFEGEEGVDAGALQSTFLSSWSERWINIYLKEMKRGVPPKRLGFVKPAWNRGDDGSSLHTQRWSRISLSSPAIFHCLLTGFVDDEYIPPDMKPCKDDLPQSLPYKDLVEFVETVCYHDAIQ